MKLEMQSKMCMALLALCLAVVLSIPVVQIREISIPESSVETVSEVDVMEARETDKDQPFTG